MAHSTEERQERIRVLEERLRRRSPAGVRAEVALLAAAAAAVAIWTFQRQGVAYFFSDPAPLQLGREGEYRWDLLASNRYAQIHGAPTTQGLYDPGGEHVVVGLRDTPVMVRRRAIEGEAWDQRKRAVPPQPDQRPFAVDGRLLELGEAPAWARQAAQTLQQGDQLRPVDGRLWVLVAGERPRQDRGAVLATSLLAAFAALNAFLAVRDARHRLGRRARQRPT